MYKPSLTSADLFKSIFLKTFTVITFLSCLSPQQMFGQVADNFADGEFVSNPSWSGTDSKFVISSGRLRLQAPSVNDQAYLSTPSASINNAIWEFYVRMEFNPSSSNFGRVYLTSDQSNLTGSLNGYFVGVGNASDKISLYRQTGTGTPQIVVQGTVANLDDAIVEVKVKVTRDAEGNWQLFSDEAPFATYDLEGTAFDDTHFSSSFFGVHCVYTSTRSDDFYFDDFAVTGDPFVDTIAPELQTVTVLSPTQLDLLFSEPLDIASAENISNYLVAGIGNPTSALIASNHKNVTLTFPQSFTNGIESTLTVTSIADTAENILMESGKTFLFFQASPVSYRDLIITEIFSDFSPVIGLPEKEFIELYNRSVNPIDLQNWKITDGSSVGTLPSKIILPGDYVIVTASANVSLFQPFGATVGVANFPTLNNTADTLRLTDHTDQPVDSVWYTDEWYRDEDKKQGGFTLELIDPENTCKGDDNWTASVNESGGTPGSQNSVYANIVDTEGPELISAILKTPDTVLIIFNERLNAVTPSITSFDFEPSVDIQSVEFVNSSLRSLYLILDQKIDADRSHRITVTNIFDCPGNNIEGPHSEIYLNPDSLPPLIDSLKVLSTTSLTIYFNERLNRTTSENSSHYFIRQAENPIEVSVDSNEKQVLLTFAKEFENGWEQTLIMLDLSDINGNVKNDTTRFFYFEPNPVSYRDVIITEIFPDPSPVIGLPEAEFVEILNRSPHPINLRGWAFSDGSSNAVVTGDRIILPGEYFILTSSAAGTSFNPFGKTISLNNFPTINNSADALVLKKPDGENIDSVRFSSSWFNDDDKRQGGWSLELINPEDICKQSANWTPSIDTIFGGTPGRKNSVYTVINDITGPEFLSVTQLDSVSIELHFNEPLNENLPTIGQIEIAPPVSISTIQFADEQRDNIIVSFSQQLQDHKTYRVLLHAIYDCPGNLIDEQFASAFLNLDTIPPVLKDVSVKNETQIELTFSEDLEAELSERTENFSFEDETYEITSAKLQAGLKSVLLSISRPLPNGEEKVLAIRDLSDINGNVIHPISISVFLFKEKESFYKDVVVTELFADPSPTQGLPENEFLEVFNRSNNPINLKNWTLTDGSSIAKFAYLVLLPKQYLIVSSYTGQLQLSGWGKSTGVPNFPSLNNSSDYITLRNSEGLLIDSVNYYDDWYRDEEKKQGGFTLELIDPENICSEQDNWTASEALVGGTPGMQNSVFANKPDMTGPFLLSAVATNERTILLTFNEKLDTQIPGIESFNLAGYEILVVDFKDETLRRVELTLNTILEKNVLYTIHTNSVYDCAGNIVDELHSSASFALPENANENDIIINEVLFNPRPTGVDFVEIYNRSNKFLNLKGWSLANLVQDTLENKKVISENDLLIFPGGYVVVTEDGNVLKGEYLLGREEYFVNASSLPSMSDDEGSVALLDTAGMMIDHFSYSDKMHSVFLKEVEGASLERVSVEAETNNVENWKSSSEDNGFATPGYRNSNARGSTVQDESIVIEPEIFQPQDFAKISYHFEKGGFVANVKIFDPQGREVKELAHNHLLGTDGFFRWDGDEKNGSKVSVGNYLVWFEVFNDEGAVQTFRKRVAVAGKF